MRRRDREVTDIDVIKRILDSGMVLHLGLVDDGLPYVVPMNYGYTFKGDKLIFYIHGALEGRKLDVIKKNPDCCAQIEYKVQPFPGDVACQYGCSYYSFMGFGKIHVVEDVEEKMQGLSVLMKTQTGMDFEFNEKLVSVVNVFRIDCDNYTAKHRPLPPAKAIVRPATKEDLPDVCKIYDHILDSEERGESVIGWQRGVYPGENVAKAALERGDLFVITKSSDPHDTVVGTAILNQIQVDVYAEGNWKNPANDDEVMVMHTLVIDPAYKGKGYGRVFLEYYETYARNNGCSCLRMDTNEKNVAAREFYKSFGYEEVGVVPCEFNGIKGVNLVLLEKMVGK